MEAQILQAIEIDYIDESEVLSPADDKYHIDKKKFDVPFVCGAKDLGEALRRIGGGCVYDPHKGRTGHRRRCTGRAPHTNDQPANVRTEEHAGRRAVSRRERVGGTV